MSKKNKAGSNLGRTLIKDRFGHKQHSRKVDNDTMLHTTEIQDGYDWGRLNLSSVTEESSFQAFLRTAELAGTEFQAEKLNIAFVNPKQGIGLLSKTQQQVMEQKHSDNRELLKIPRRPKWTKDMSAEDLQRAESNVFLEWRRDLAQLQENDEEIIMTPYEKNLEFWRQLWRVVERSDVVVQIVDARNPLLFRSDDLERYVKEVSPHKMNMILVNKADLLDDAQRQHWAEYFDGEGMRTAFFSAVLAAEELKRLAEEAREQRDAEQQHEKEHAVAQQVELAAAATPKIATAEAAAVLAADELSQAAVRQAAGELNRSLDKLETQLSKIELQINPVAAAAAAAGDGSVRNNPKVLTREELIEFFKTVYDGEPSHRHTPSVTTIGLVGYPNVGKSSTINALMTEKKVSVSATPGKTKHFQTLFLDSDLMLCDCPGLVMPSFVLTKADMILNGILPIDQMRDHVPAVNLLCMRIPRHILEEKYGIIIAKPMEGEDPERPPHSEELLLAYGFNRGFMTSNGQPDQSRSARYVCKDYVNGKLLFADAPPTVPQAEFQTFPPKTRKDVEEQTLPSQQQRAMRISNKNASSKELDTQFFDSNRGKAYVKGRSDFPHIRVAEDGNNVLAGAAPLDKPWRRVKKERREKLRNKFAHLDQH